MAQRGKQTDGERGSALLEFVLVVPVFLYVLYAMVAFGLSLAVKEDVTHAAAEGARATLGATGGSSTNLTPWETAATTRIDQVLNWLPNTPTIAYTGVACPSTNDSNGYCLTVKVTYPGSPIGNFSVPGLSLVVPSNINASAEIQVQ